MRLWQPQTSKRRKRLRTHLALACPEVCSERAGWKRMALLVLYFAPDTLRFPDNFRAVSERLLVRTLSARHTSTCATVSLASAVQAWTSNELHRTLSF